MLNMIVHLLQYLRLQVEKVTVNNLMALHLCSVSAQTVLEGPINNGAWIFAEEEHILINCLRAQIFIFHISFTIFKGHVYQDFNKTIDSL